VVVPGDERSKASVNGSVNSRFTQRIIANSSNALCSLVKKGQGSPYSITERRVSELIPVLGSQPAGGVSHKPGGRLPLLFARPAVTPPQPLRGLVPILLLRERRHDGCKQFA